MKKTIYLFLFMTLSCFSVVQAASLKKQHIVVATRGVEKIPDENSSCYKQCSSERLSCRKKCFPIKPVKDCYKCLDACDPPFNNQCVPKCPTVDNV